MSLPGTWWIVARSEEVTGKTPLAVDLGDQPLVLWRDANGAVNALEDRCPHRRVPLSLGCIRENGWIQCGYHGWTYDGATGQLKEIPNLKGDRRFPPLYRAQTFPVAESGGFVRIGLAAASDPPRATATTMPLSGTAHVAIAQRDYVAALYDDPALLIAIGGVRFTPYLMSALHEEDGLLVMERSCQWGRLHWPATFSAEFPLTLLSRTEPATGETELVLRDDRFATLLTALIAPVQAARGVTAIRWRAEIGTTIAGRYARRLRRGTPFTVRESIDAAALRTLKPSVSLHGLALTAALTAPSPQPVAA